MLRRSLTALVALLLAVPATAQLSVIAPAYVGCILPTALPGDVKSVSSATSQALCDTACTTTYQYNYFVSSTSSCYCSNTPPPATALQTASNYLGTCASGQAKAQKLATSYQWTQCGSAINYYQGPLFGKVAASAYECMQWCNNVYHDVTWVFASYYPAGNSSSGASGPWCDCSGSIGIYYATCTSSSVYTYMLERSLTSWVVRRDARLKREQDARSQQLSLGLCPYPLEACIVGNNGYECMDTRAELEACGGCVDGTLTMDTDGSAGSRNASANVGTDCLALPGVDPKRTTCIRGQCTVAGCRAGWRLVDGRCVEYRPRYL